MADDNRLTSGSLLHGTSSQKLLAVLLGFRRTKKFCDITIVTGEKNFYGHSCVLAAVSPYFMGLLRSGMSEVTSNFMKVDVDLAFLSVHPSSMNSVLDYVYGEDIEINPNNVFELLVIADYLLLADLKNELCSYLCENMTVDSCFPSMRYAEMYGCKSLHVFSDHFLKTRFFQFSQTLSFCELSLEEVEYILGNDELAANEIEVFHSIITWVNHSHNTRKEFFDQLFQHIRLDSISEEDIRVVQQLLVQNHLAQTSSAFKTDCLWKLCEPSKCSQYISRMGQQVVLVFGDRQRSGSASNTKKTMCYLPVPHEWCDIETMPKSRRGFKAAELNGLIYILGGVVGNSLSLSVWCYNPETNKWSDVAPMLKTAASFGLASLGGHLYAIGGPNKEQNVQQYDPRLNSWCFVKPMRVTRDDHCVVAFQDKYLFAIGGHISNAQSMYSVERYDSQSNMWTDMAELNIGRIQSSAITFGDKIFVVGGYGGVNQRAIKSCEVFHSLRNEWCLIASTNSPMQAAGIAVVAGTIYIFGGNHGKHIHIECYSEENDSWDVISMFTNVSQEFQCCTVALSGHAICRNVLHI